MRLLSSTIGLLTSYPSTDLEVEFNNSQENSSDWSVSSWSFVSRVQFEGLLADQERSAVAASIGRMAVVLKAESLNKRFYLDPNSRSLSLPTAVGDH